MLHVHSTTQATRILYKIPIARILQLSFHSSRGSHDARTTTKVPRDLILSAVAGVQCEGDVGSAFLLRQDDEASKVL